MFDMVRAGRNAFWELIDQGDLLGQGKHLVISGFLENVERKNGISC